MFDTHKIDVKFPDKVLIEQKRACTDESIRLLKEFEEKAVASILEKIQVQDNLYNYTIVFRRDSLMQILVDVKIGINGKEFLNTFRVNRTLDEAIEQIYKWMGSLFAQEALKEIFQSNAHLSNLGYGTFKISNVE